MVRVWALIIVRGQRQYICIANLHGFRLLFLAYLTRVTLFVNCKKWLWFQHALKTKFKSRKSSDKKEHWLDYAESRFGRKSIHDIKLLLRVLFLYIPLPIFWALYDQQVTNWLLFLIVISNIVYIIFAFGLQCFNFMSKSNENYDIDYFFNINIYLTISDAIGKCL